MSDNSENQLQTPLQQKLAEAHRNADAGEYREALALVRDAKALEPRNIYVLAFEKQVEQLAELSDLKLLTDEQRGDIIDSLPGIVERALEGSSAASAQERDTRAELDRERQERAAALEWLKNQYFQHAHEYVKNGQYQHALAEIRRVYIIDPNNNVAKDFEKQIDQLIALKRAQTPQRAATGPGGATRDDGTGAPAGGQPETTGEQKRGLNLTLIIAIILTIVAVAIAAYYFFARQKMLKPPSPTDQDVTEMTAPGRQQAAEQAFLLSQAEGSGTVQTSVTPDPRSTPPPEVVASEDFAPRVPGGSAPPGENATETPPSQKSGASNQSETPSSRSSSEPATSSSSNPSKSSQLSVTTEGITQDARIIRLERPTLPAGINATGLEGQVVVQVEIDEDGNPGRVRILRTTNDLLHDPVVDAVLRSKFSARRTPTGPVSSWLTIPFTFRRNR